MWITAFFTEDDEPAINLSPTIRGRDLSDGSLVITDAAMTEKGDGFYAYNFAGFDITKDYAFLCDSVTLSGTERYTYAGSGEYNNLLNSIDSTVDGIESTVDNVDVRTVLMRKLQTNRLELEDGDTGNWILYDDDNTTPLLTFDVTDKSGGGIAQYPTTPSRRSKGY